MAEPRAVSDLIGFPRLPSFSVAVGGRGVANTQLRPRTTAGDTPQPPSARKGAETGTIEVTPRLDTEKPTPDKSGYRANGDPGNSIRASTFSISGRRPGTG